MGFQHMKKTPRLILIPLSIAIFLFVSVGYLLSDDFYFNMLIRKNGIKTPEDAFEFFKESTVRGDDENSPFLLDAPIQGLTPRYLLTKRKFLTCDEGAILLATIVHELGYETRLVDLLDKNNVGRHTILEIYQDGYWKTYGTLRRIEGIGYRESYKVNVGDGDFGRPRYRKYPKLYNLIINNNFFLKRLALQIREIQGVDSAEHIKFLLSLINGEPE